MPQANLLQSAAAQDPPGTRAVGARASFSLGLPPFPRLLAIGRWILLVLIALSALSWFVLLRTAEDATRTIGHDTTVSIVAAEQIRTLLGDADGQLANIMLSAKGQDGPFVSALRQDVRDAESLIVEAAQNITFGDAEKGPLTTMVRGVAEFELLVGLARSGGAAGTPAADRAREADTLMHFTILPAAATLDRANFDHLSEGYDGYRAERLSLASFVVLAVGATLLLLVALQVRIATKTKRLLNPGLLAATVVLGLFCAVATERFLVADDALRVAKQDCFDSLAALTTAKALASDANAAESYWLLAHGDAPTQAALDATFAVRAGRLLRDPARAAATLAGGGKLEGLLGDELANITFAGERDAATATLRAWLAYLAIDGKIRALERAGRSDEAVKLDIGTAPGESNWAFARFADALDRTLLINQREFDGAIARAEAAVGRMLTLGLLASWVLASAAVWIGIRARLEEYEF